MLFGFGDTTTVFFVGGAEVNMVNLAPCSESSGPYTTTVRVVSVFSAKLDESKSYVATNWCWPPPGLSLVTNPICGFNESHSCRE